MENIAKAFLKAQSQMSNASKGSTNPFFKSKYADLNSVREAVLPHLNENGISVLQPTVTIDGKNYVRTMLMHESGETIQCDTEILFIKQSDPQAQGSGITYARRYGLQSLVCIGSEDDDGNKGSEQAKIDDNKPWLNKWANKDKTEVMPTYINLVGKAREQGKTANDLKQYYKISKEIMSELENDLN